MELNEDKCHLLILGFKHEVLWADIGGKRIWESKENKLLGLHTDRNLKFYPIFPRFALRQDKN